MSKLLIATLALVVAARGEPCSDGSDTCQASDDEVTLAQLRATKLHTFTSRVACNYGGDCNGNQCCPGAEETCGQTYRCPNADSSFQGCEYNGAVPKPGCSSPSPSPPPPPESNSCCCWWWPAGVTETCGNCGNCEKSTPQDNCHGGQSGSLWCPDGENLLQKSSTAAEQEPTTVEDGEECNGSLSPEFATVCKSGSTCNEKVNLWPSGVCIKDRPNTVLDGETCNGSVSPESATVCQSGSTCYVAQPMPGASGICVQDAPNNCKANDHVKCPGSGAMCSGNQCCPAVEVSGGVTFPCPSAPDFAAANCQLSEPISMCVG